MTCILGLCLSVILIGCSPPNYHTYYIKSVSQHTLEESDCEGANVITNLKYVDAQEYMGYYNTNRPNVYKYNNDEFPKGYSIDICMTKAMEVANSRYSLLSEYGGFIMKYGLKKSSFTTKEEINKNRLGIFLPLKTSGEPYSESMLKSLRLVYIDKIPESFHDPCPPLCDY